MYQYSFTSQVKSQKQTGNSGLTEKYHPKHLRFPTDLGMLKAGLFGNVNEPKVL
jgi:hypothetical protein